MRADLDRIAVYILTFILVAFIILIGVLIVRMGDPLAGAALKGDLLVPLPAPGGGQ